MHRVDADGYTTVGGKRRFIDRNLPTEQGTEDKAYMNNAVQEEIALAIEAAGLTLRSSGAADESAGWGQLAAAIFASNAISNAGLANDLDLDKFSTGSVDVGLVTIDTSNGYIEIKNTGDTKRIRVSASGIRSYWTGIPGSQRTVMNIQYDIRSWLASASRNDATTSLEDSHTHVTGVSYSNGAAGYALSIPLTSNIFGATVSYVEDTSGFLVDNVPVKLRCTDDGSGNRSLIAVELWGIGRTVTNYDPDLSEFVWLNVSAEL